jgi:hypothetical protein
MTTELYKFYKKAGLATYAGAGKPEEHSERSGFREFVYAEGDYSYRDSYVGYTRSRGAEVIRYKGKPIWASSYGGGMVEGKEELAEKTFDFLKKALRAADPGTLSVRGPQHFIFGPWIYEFNMAGDIMEFTAKEEIFYKGDLVFFHHIIGGQIKS